MIDTLNLVREPVSLGVKGEGWSILTILLFYPIIRNVSVILYLPLVIYKSTIMIKLVHPISYQKDLKSEGLREDRVQNEDSIWNRHGEEDRKGIYEISS